MSILAGEKMVGEFLDLRNGLALQQWYGLRIHNNYAINLCAYYSPYEKYFIHYKSS